MIFVLGTSVEPLAKYGNEHKDSITSGSVRNDRCSVMPHVQIRLVGG